jgi:gamma-glutamylaminecyclotransferase
MKVFVYGSLKAGYWNNVLLHGSKFLGEDYAEGLLYAGSSFPMAIPSHVANKGVGEHQFWIKGEVYEVDVKTLERLDRLEGHPHHYERQQVVLKSGTKASMYFYKQSVAHLKFIPEGIWKGRR